MRKITPEDITLRREDRSLNTAEIIQMKSNLDKIVADKNVSNRDKKLARKTFETIASSGANASINNGSITFNNSVGKNIDDKIAYRSKTLLGKAAELFTGNGIGLDKTLMRSLSKGISNDAVIKDPMIKATNNVRDHYNSLNIKGIDTPSVQILDISNVSREPFTVVEKDAETILEIAAKAKAAKIAADAKAAAGKKKSVGKKTDAGNKTTVANTEPIAVQPASDSESDVTMGGEVVSIPNTTGVGPRLNVPPYSGLQPSVQSTSQPVIETDAKIIELNNLISEQGKFENFNRGEIDKLNAKIKVIIEALQKDTRGVTRETRVAAQEKLSSLRGQVSMYKGTNVKHSAIKKKLQENLRLFKIREQSSTNDAEIKKAIKKDGGVIKLQWGKLLIPDLFSLRDKVKSEKYADSTSPAFLWSLAEKRRAATLSTKMPIARPQIPNNNIKTNAVTSTNSKVAEVIPKDSSSGLNINNTTDVIVNKTPISGIQALSALFPAVSAFAMKRNSANINYAEQYVAPARGLNQDYINSMSNSLGAGENQALNNNTSTDFSTRMNMAANLGANRTKAFNELNVNDANAYSQSKALEIQGINANNNSRNEFTNNYKIGVAKAKNEDQQVKVTGLASSLGAFSNLTTAQLTEQNMRRSQGMQLSQANATNNYTSDKELLMANYTQNKNLFNPLVTSKDSNGTYIDISTGKPYANQQMFIDAEQNLGKITSDLNGLNTKYNKQQIENFNRDINSGTKRRGFLPWLTGSQGNRVFKKGGLTLIERKELQSHREYIKDITKDLKRLTLDYIKENNSQNNKVEDRNLKKLRLLLLRK